VRIPSRTAAAVLAMSVFAGSAVANDLGIVSPATVEATIVGSTEMIVHIPETGTRGQTVAPVDVTNQQLVEVQPGSGQPLDMSGYDGSLRSCYANGGIAKQGEDLVYRCTLDTTQSGVEQASAYVTPSHSDTGYDGTNNVADPALLDCMNRGGSLIQLAGNQQFACAM